MKTENEWDLEECPSCEIMLNSSFLEMDIYFSDSSIFKISVLIFNLFLFFYLNKIHEWI